MSVLRAARRSAGDNGVALTAKALAYSLFLAIPAVLLVVLGLFSVFADTRTVGGLVDHLRPILPHEATVLLEQSLDRAAQQPRRGLVLAITGFALALWSTTSAATTLMEGLTSTYGHRDARGFLRRRLIALLIVVCLALGAVLTFGLLVLGPHLEAWLGTALGSGRAVSWVWWTAQWPILIVGLLFSFAVVLYVGPDARRPEWKLVSPGALTAVVLWLAGSGGFAAYAAWFGSYDKTWGTLSAVVVTLVWLWLTSAALLFGAEVNAEVSRRDR